MRAITERADSPDKRKKRESSGIVLVAWFVWYLLFAMVVVFWATGAYWADAPMIHP